MTLDELISALQELRDRCPAAALATVIHGEIDIDSIRYDRGRVYLDEEARREWKRRERNEA